MRRIAFLVLPQFSHLGLAAAIEPLFVANWLVERKLFEWRVVSADGLPVRASNGMLEPVDGDLGAADGCETVFVLASFDAAEAVENRRVLAWLRRIARFGVEIGGIENGSLVLAEAGLLDGREAAIHWDNLIGFKERYPAVQASAQLYVRSGDRPTCAGASSILDMMITWMAGHTEGGLEREVADHLLLGEARPARTPQRRGRHADRPQPDDKVAAAQAIMTAHLDEPISCPEIAERLGLSLRQLERRFARVLGRTLAQEYRLLRLAKAHQLLQQTKLSVTEVALACGFASPEHFSRLYRGTFRCAPSRDRRQSTDAPVLRSGRSDGM
ncbi:MAG TPA: GlxA family transcriptional regulator [Stellaceae bacterium]|nr:GlxA family transcriptional regulator [Stellaceae bacterium]